MANTPSAFNSIGAVNPTSFVGGRLTLASGTPVTTGDVTAATTLYFTPYVGENMDLYTGSVWSNFQLSQVSITNSGLSATTVYDVFMQYNSGTPQLSLTAWTNSTTRATALAYQNGVLVLSGTATSRYLGTIYTDGSSEFNDGYALRYVWNYYNRVNKPMAHYSSTSSWTYATDAWRQANADSTNQLNFVTGAKEDTIDVSLSVTYSNNSNATFGIGLCPNSAFNAVNLYPLVQPNYAVFGDGQMTASFNDYVAIGVGYISWNEIVTSPAGTVTFYGNSLGQSGLIANFLC